MKNSTQPIQNLIKLIKPVINLNLITSTKIELGINEFTDQDDKLGLFSQTVDPYEFMSIEEQD